MIPANTLGRKQLSNCKIYNGSDHNHEAQKPTLIKLNLLNSKNILR